MISSAMLLELQTVIGRYLGEEAAKMYQDFYQGESEQTVLDSAQALLEEVIGHTRASQLIISLKERHAGSAQ